MEGKTANGKPRKRKPSPQKPPHDDQHLKGLIELLSDWTWEQDAEFRFTCFGGADSESIVGKNPIGKQSWETGLEIEGGWERHQALLETHQPFHDTVMHRLLPDRTRRYISMSGVPIFDDHGRFQGYRGIGKDFTERKLEEEALRQSEEKYRTILEITQEGYFEDDLAGNLTFFNDSVCRIWGYTREELMGMNFRHYSDKETAKNVYQAYAKLYRTGEQIKALEEEIIRKDGTKAFAEVSASLIWNSEGEPIGFRGMTRDITERKHAEDGLRQSEERYRTILDEMEDGYFEIDLTGKFTFFNDANCRHLGYSREEMLGTNSINTVVEEDRERLNKIYSNIFRTATPARGISYKIIRKDGTTGFAETAAFPFRNQKGEIIGFRGVGRDITERRQMEEALRQSEERYRTIIEELEEWYFETDLSGNITFFNEIFAHVLGYSRDSLTGVNFRSLIKKEDWDSIFELFNQVFKTGQPTRNFPYEFIRPDGTVTSAEFSIFPKQDGAGGISGFRGVGHDITERKRAEARIQYLATHDALTDLPNRMMFSQLLNHTIQSSRRFNRQFAIFFIDLDSFKEINDTLGHEAGDQLLQEIARRLKNVLREIDMVARLGGDEFVILVEEVNDQGQVTAVAQRILSAVMKPIILMNQECRVTASIGISMYPKDAQDEQSIMKNADLAMYLAKEKGKNNYQFFSKKMKSQSFERLSLETNLRHALERQEFSLDYQAKLDFKTGAITGVEALLRWHNPDLGNVPPTRFIPMAEETGLIVPIGRWVLKTACAQNVAWQRQGLATVCLEVNLSIHQLLDDTLLPDLRTTLKETGLAPNLLELEITESMLMRNPERVIKILTEIKKLGVRLAIDDFGTGYSSLGQLKRSPIDTLKVDRSFIRDLLKNPEDQAITEAIIAMGKTFSLTVIAEGVETEEQDAFLRSRACDEMQGYYFSKPTPPDRFADLLRKHIPPPTNKPSP